MAAKAVKDKREMMEKRSQTLRDQQVISLPFEQTTGIKKAGAA